MADIKHFMPAWIKGAKGGEYYISPNGTKIYRAGYGSKGMKERYKAGLKGGGAGGPGAGHKPPPPTGGEHKPPPAPPKAPPKEEPPKEKPEVKLARAKAGKGKGSIPSIAHLELKPLKEETAIRARTEPGGWIKDNHDQLTHASQVLAATVGGKRSVRVGKFIHDSSQPNIAGYFNSGEWKGGRQPFPSIDELIAPGTIALSKNVIGHMAEARLHGLDIMNYEGFKTYTHEVMHAASHAGHAYEPHTAKSRPHAVLEEATTEIAAQHYAPHVAEKMGAKMKTEQARADLTAPIFKLKMSSESPSGVPKVETRRAVSYSDFVHRFANVALLSRGIDVRDPAFDMKQHNDASITSNITAVSLETKKRGSNARFKALATDILKHHGVDMEAMTKVPDSPEYAARQHLIRKLKAHLGARPGRRETQESYLRDEIKTAVAVSDNFGHGPHKSPGGGTSFTSLRQGD